MKNYVKQKLQEKGITPYRMAKDLNISFMTSYNWCNSNNLSPAKMKLIADYLGVNINDVFEL